MQGGGTWGWSGCGACGAGAVLAMGHCCGLWPSLCLVALGVPGKWVAALEGSIRCAMWGCGPSSGVVHWPNFPQWCLGGDLSPTEGPPGLDPGGQLGMWLVQPMALSSWRGSPCLGMVLLEADLAAQAASSLWPGLFRGDCTVLLSF